MSVRSLFSTSCAATVLMVVYMTMSILNIYRLMFPLTFVDVNSSGQFCSPLWKPASRMHMQVYLSTRPRFSRDFLHDESAEESPPKDIALLWEQPLREPSYSKSFLFTINDCSHKDCSTDQSYRFATDWLDHAEHTALSDGGILNTISSAAGHGIESTSILLTLYQKLSHQLHSFLTILGMAGEEKDPSHHSGLLGRTNVTLSPSSPLWNALATNSTLYIHVLVVQTEQDEDKPTSTDILRASQSHAVLFGHVNLVKYDEPHHIEPAKRILYHDLVYLVRKYLLLASTEHPPWDMSHSKPQEHATYLQALAMKEHHVGYPYWKPEVAIKYVNDLDVYPLDLAGLSGMELARTRQGIVHLPALHVDEIGLTSEKYIPINETLTSLPLRISVDRSDLEHHTTTTTATAGGMSPARWRLMTHLSRSIESQKQMGFEQSDIDDVRRLVADTNVTLLTITLVASALHLLFEFLTFKSEVSFWRNNKDLTGLSVRALFLDMVGQVVILLFLIEKDSSLLMTVPSGCGCLIALWKCQRAAGLQFVKLTDRNKSVSWWNRLPRLFGYELRALRLELAQEQIDGDAAASSTTITKQNLASLTIECDRTATRTLGRVLVPLVLAYTFYSLVQEEHLGWYSWLITSASSAVYALGFMLMTPQLFLNWKLKSVAHLPWRVLIYKSLNTFIDDLFSFIIRMPTMARLSCFRDDVVFIIYLYQRWLYPVDTSRPVEGVGEGSAASAASPDDLQKKNQ